MRNSRKKSLIIFYERNGLWESLKLLFQLFLFKVSFSKSIKVKDFPRCYLRNHTSDLPVFRQIMMDGEYDFHVPFEPAVIIDLGANIGISGIFFATKFPNAKVIALEPYMPNFIQLQKNVQHILNIKPIHAGIWSKSSQLSVVGNYVGDEWGTTVAEIKGNEGNDGTVKAMTMEEVLAMEKIDIIDILKVDIEGSEKELFDNSHLWINKTKMIVIELHDFMRAGCSMSFIKALSNIEKYAMSIRGENIIVTNLSL